MFDATPRLQLPVLPPTPDQPQVVHNEALDQLDVLTALRLLDRDLATPPSSPADSDAYLVHATATGVWAGKEGQIAWFANNAWDFIAPVAGLCAYIADESLLVAYTGSAWVDYAALMNFQNLAMLGLNTSADSTNKLAVKSAALLFDNIGNGVQAKLNKHAAGDTASLLYQDNYSGRAELGLCGDDNFHLKVSPDGSAWTESLVIDKSSGYLGRGTASPLAPLHLALAGSAVPTAASAGSNSGTAMQITAEAIASFNMTVISSASAGTRGTMNGVRARGSFAGAAAVQANDQLFSFVAAGYDGAAYQNGGSVDFLCDGTPSSGHVPVRVSIKTGTSSGDRTERLQVTSAGLVGVNCTPAVQLDVAGPVRVGQYTVAGLPAASVGAGQLVYVSNESGGAVLAFSDGSAWRRVTDRAVVS